MKTKITFERDRRGSGLLQNMRRNIDQRRAPFGNERRRQFRAGAIGHVKRAALRIQDARGAFDNQTMQIVRAYRFGECFAEPVQKIEDESLLDLDLFFRTLQLPDAERLPPRGVNPAGQRRDKQGKEKNWPHERSASLLRCGLMEVLL